MKKYLKYGLIGTVLASTAGVIIGFSTSWNDLPTISVGGSSAISPLITEYSNIYTESDIVVQAGGSGAGISYALDGKKNIGMASKDPHALENDEIKNKWIANEMKTITIAWDGIGIVYKPFDSNATLDINNQTIQNIYKAFAGFEVKGSELNLGNTDNLLTSFARDGGAVKSGTADAFLQDSGFSSTIPDNIKTILENGQYKKQTVSTGESNVEAWENIKSNNLSGSMVYLSSGFILNNLKEIQDSGFKVATYNGSELSKETIAQPNKYEWFRPFNLIVSLKTITDPIKKFIDFTINPSTKRDQILNELGFVGLTQAQNNSMIVNNNFWTSTDQLVGRCGAGR